MPAAGARPGQLRGADRSGSVPRRHDLRPLAERDHNVEHWSEFSRGGHFAAMEAPDLLVGDVRDFFRRFR